MGMAHLKKIWESVQDKILTVNNINKHVVLVFVLRTSVLEFPLPRVLVD
jgi:hypothetical protein